MHTEAKTVCGWREKGWCRPEPPSVLLPVVRRLPSTQVGPGMQLVLSTYLVNKQMSSNYYVPGPVLGAGEAALSRTDSTPWKGEH